MPWPVERKYVEEAEEKLKVSFPPAFVSVMRTQNGGRLQIDGQWWDLHPFWDRSSRKRLARTSHDIVRETIRARELEGFPKEAVVIGSNEQDDHLLFMPAAKPNLLGPTIFLWKMRGGEQPSKLFEHPFELWEHPED